MILIVGAKGVLVRGMARLLLLAEFPLHLTTLEEFIHERVEEKKQLPA